MLALAMSAVVFNIHLYQMEFYHLNMSTKSCVIFVHKIKMLSISKGVGLLFEN